LQKASRALVADIAFLVDEVRLERDIGFAAEERCAKPIFRR